METFMQVTPFSLSPPCACVGEAIPFRLFVSCAMLPLLAPTMHNVGTLLSVKYMLHFVLIDEFERRYFKQIEVQFDRKRVEHAGPDGRQVGTKAPVCASEDVVKSAYRLMALCRS